MNIKNIHLIGICGVAMGSLAGMLTDSGYNVAGSDENIYPPMSNILMNKKVPLYTGFRRENIQNPDLVIIGNSISRGNAEVEMVLDESIPYMSMAQAIYAFFLHDREVINISGTHGKSTTTALLAHILECAGEDPSFLIGATSKNYGSNYKLGGGRYFVIEGDEYDSAFFEKVPKFMMYRPRHLVLTSLEFDHADIFRDVDEIGLWFKRLVNLVPSKGNIVYSADYPSLSGIVKKPFSNAYSYGKIDSDFKYAAKGYNGDMALCGISSRDFGGLELRSSIFGEFNCSNIAAAASMALVLNVKKGAVIQGIESFTGILRRQELIYEKGKIKIFEDFAHHPTAVRCVLNTMRERFVSSRLWAVYEPRSATSRRNTFQDIIHESFLSADVVLIKTPYRIGSIKESERIDIDLVCRRVAESGRVCYLFNKTESMIKYILDNINFDAGNIIVIMSNGGFDGIYSKLIDGIDGVN